MPREYGKEYPERKLMAVISDLLGINHFTTSKGSTVRKDFLRAVAAALEVPDYEHLNKDPLLQAIIEHVTNEEMDPDLFSTGTTITDEALLTIANGIVENGFYVHRHETEAEADAAPLTTEQILDLLDPERSQPPDIRDQLVRSYHDEHDTFRQMIIRAYSGRCALTESDVLHTLKAVYVIPPSVGGPDLVSNGILLRADLAGLFENNLMVFDENERTVILHPGASGPSYAPLSGRKLRDPVPPGNRPAVPGLEWRRERADL